MPEFNEQLARNVVKRIKESPEHWDQMHWHCETGMCFAGFTAIEAGGKWDAFDMESVRTPEGELLHVREFAARELGIDNDDEMDRHSLFCYRNTIKDLEFLIDKLSEGNNA